VDCHQDREALIEEVEIYEALLSLLNFGYGNRTRSPRLLVETPQATKHDVDLGIGRATEPAAGM
jgi:hypothetical protein